MYHMIFTHIQYLIECIECNTPFLEGEGAEGPFTHI